MDERTAEHLLYVDATLAEMGQPAARGRTAYDSDLAVARACQVQRHPPCCRSRTPRRILLAAHPTVPWRIIKGMRNRIAHNYWTVDDDIVWDVVEQHARQLHHALTEEIDTARSVLETGDK